MQIIPVIDLKDGQVVRAVGGRREAYRPIVSQLTSSTHALDVARAFRAHFGLTHLYLADLDALTGAPAALATYAALTADGFWLWVDAGVKEPAAAEPLLQVGVGGIVAGLESLPRPDHLFRLRDQLGEQLIFSLDLKNGRPLADPRAWGTENAWDVARHAAETGVRHVIVLDLAQVGTFAGVGTEALCGLIAQTYPEITVVAGGGVRDMADLRRLQHYSVGGVLVASALHDGRLSRADLLSPPCQMLLREGEAPAELLTLPARQEPRPPEDAAPQARQEPRPPELEH